MDEELQLALSLLNHLRFTPGRATGDWRETAITEHELHMRELAYLEQERASITADAARAPHDGPAFVHWFESLRATGPGQHDPLFPWLADHATLAELKWFLQQEIGGEAGFEDLVALTQLKLPTGAKLELARNYWDELGRGSESGMHGLMLARLATDLELDATVPVVVEALALGNLMGGLAANRRYTYQSIGALGVVELTAPGRSAHVNAALKRCGVSAHARQYYALHATLDIKHSEAWNREVLLPLVTAEPELAPAIAEGALLRLRAGARCFARYRRELRHETRRDQTVSDGGATDFARRAWRGAGVSRP